MKKNYFLISEGDRVFRVPYNQISHFTARRSLTIVHTKDRQYVHYKNIGKIKNEIKERPNFIFTHKSYLLNLDHVAWLSKKGSVFVVLNDGSKVPISRRRKRTIVKTYFSNYKRVERKKRPFVVKTDRW
jgi:DNA-binding LytR/AlgR family response regulator